MRSRRRRPSSCCSSQPHSKIRNCFPVGHDVTAFSLPFDPPFLRELDRFFRKTICTAVVSTALASVPILNPCHNIFPLPTYAADLSHSNASAVEVTPNEHKAAVEDAWKIVHDYYLDSTYNGINWEAERNIFQSADIQDTKQSYKVIRKMISKLGDKYTRALDPTQMKSLGKFDVSGVGLLLINNAAGKLVVGINPPPGTAAADAGVKRGDEVLSVEGRSINEGTAFEVAQWMQGPDGSQMHVKFRDAGETSLIRHFKGADWSGKDSSVTAVPQTTLVDTPEGSMGYIHLSEFRASARTEVAAALKELKARGAQWVLLDLRGNGGGVFEGAVEIAGLFEGEGKTVALVMGRGAPSNGEKFLSHFIPGETDVETGMDLGILIDHGSASSSEVLAGGLHDSCRAALVGNRSYGKGVIQGVFGLSDGGGIAVTVAEYRTPNGTKIDGNGLKPDIELKNSFRDVMRFLGVEHFGEKSFSVSRAQIQESIAACRASDDMNDAEGVI